MEDVVKKLKIRKNNLIQVYYFNLILRNSFSRISRFSLITRKKLISRELIFADFSETKLFYGFGQEKQNFVELTLFLAFIRKIFERSAKNSFRGIYFRGFDKIRNFAGTYFHDLLPKNRENNFPRN